MTTEPEVKTDTAATIQLITAAQPIAAAPVAKTLTAEQLEAIRGTDTKISFKGFLNGFFKILTLYKLPINVYQGVAAKVNAVADKERVGRFAILKMPVSLFFKHGSSFAHDAVSSFKEYEDGNKKSRAVFFTGLASAGAAIWYGAPYAIANIVPAAVTTTIATVLPAGFLTTAATFAAGAIAVSPAAVLIAYPLGILAAATAAGAIGSVLSAQAMKDNWGANWLRTKLAWQGYKINASDVPPAKMEENVRVNEERKLMRKLEETIDSHYSGGLLSEESQKKLYKSLSKKFGAAAEETTGHNGAKNAATGPRGNTFQ